MREDNGREILSKSELATELQISRGRISQLLGQGMPERDDGLIGLESAVRWIYENLDNTNADRCSPAWRQAREWVWLFDRRRVRRA
jgi:hypothetical protein